MEELFRQILDKIVPTAVNAGIQTLVTGQDYGDAFKQQAGIAALNTVLGQKSPLDLFKQQQATAPAPQPQPQQQAPQPRVLTPQERRKVQAYASEQGVDLQKAREDLFPSNGTTSQGIAGVDKRGFFESLGDIVTGDAQGGRMGALKQAFLPDPKGDPSALRQYGPMGILGLLAAYKTGAFDPDYSNVMKGPYGGIGNVDLQAKYPGTYRPGVPQIARPMAHGGYAHKMAAGGFPRRNGAIAGPGTETSDDIPAMLSDGEFVMTAQAVRGAGNGNREAGIRRMYDMMNGFERSVA